MNNNRYYRPGAYSPLTAGDHLNMAREIRESKTKVLPQAFAQAWGITPQHAKGLVAKHG